ncbi:hypothetical protein [Halorubellus sp. PRR65]|uniref:hypothetical protein n=1 Tax=Halorubellus sp. PRR65 TaxID=3098148 RepID=UPI002B25FEB4|nr:hypothetical protein [Halorubellus sp. PRR65]
MTYDFEELHGGELLTVEVWWDDTFYPGQGKPDECSQTESVEMEFIGYNPHFDNLELKVRSVESDKIYRLPEICDRESVDICTEKVCHNCGQSRWIPHGEVDEVDIPGHPESEQQTFADISTELTDEDEELV